MHKHDRPVFKANDGSIHDTAPKAASHDALCLFTNMFHQFTRDNDPIPVSAMATKWIEMRTCLNKLYDEFMEAQKSPMPTEFEPIIPAVVRSQMVPTDAQVTESLNTR